MRFNPDCVRDILLECEQRIGPYEELYLEETNIPTALSKYSWDELLYHLKQCKSSNLFNDDLHEDVLGAYVVTDITPKAHELLEKIRNNTLWKKILNKGAVSIPSLISTAIEIAGLVIS